MAPVEGPGAGRKRTPAESRRCSEAGASHWNPRGDVGGRSQRGGYSLQCRRFKSAKASDLFATPALACLCLSSPPLAVSSGMRARVFPFDSGFLRVPHRVRGWDASRLGGVLRGRRRGRRGRPRRRRSRVTPPQAPRGRLRLPTRPARDANASGPRPPASPRALPEGRGGRKAPPKGRCQRCRCRDLGAETSEARERGTRGAAARATRAPHLGRGKDAPGLGRGCRAGCAGWTRGFFRLTSSESSGSSGYLGAGGAWAARGGEPPVPPPRPALAPAGRGRASPRPPQSGARAPPRGGLSPLPHGTPDPHERPRPLRAPWLRRLPATL